MAVYRNGLCTSSVLKINREIFPLVLKQTDPSQSGMSPADDLIRSHRVWGKCCEISRLSAFKIGCWFELV